MSLPTGSFCKRSKRTSTFALFFVLGVFVLVALELAGVSPILAALGDIGYRDFWYDASGVTSSPTGEKPESKLWWNDGIWWASMFNRDPLVEAYRIYRLDPGTNVWSDTGTT